MCASPVAGVRCDRKTKEIIVIFFRFSFSFQQRFLACGLGLDHHGRAYGAYLPSAFTTVYCVYDGVSIGYHVPGKKKNIVKGNNNKRSCRRRATRNARRRRTSASAKRTKTLRKSAHAIAHEVMRNNVKRLPRGRTVLVSFFFFSD